MALNEIIYDCNYSAFTSSDFFEGVGSRMIFDERKKNRSLAQNPNIESASNSSGVNNILAKYNPRQND